MLRINFCLDQNQACSFVPIINFLIGNDVMSLEEAAVLNRKFHLGEPVVFDVPNELADKVSNELKYHNFIFQID